MPTYIKHSHINIASHKHRKPAPKEGNQTRVNNAREEWDKSTSSPRHSHNSTGVGFARCPLIQTLTHTHAVPVRWRGLRLRTRVLRFSSRSLGWTNYSVKCTLLSAKYMWFGFTVLFLKQNRGTLEFVFSQIPLVTHAVTDRITGGK